MGCPFLKHLLIVRLQASNLVQIHFDDVTPLLVAIFALHVYGPGPFADNSSKLFPIIFVEEDLVGAEEWVMMSPRTPDATVLLYMRYLKTFILLTTFPMLNRPDI